MHLKVRDYGYNLRIELVLGLPGATIDSFYTEYDILANTEAWLSERFVLLLLGRSPIAQKSFIEKHKIKSALVKHANFSVFSEGTAEKYSVLKDPKYLGKYEIVVETDTYTQDNWIQMYFMDKFAGSLECCNFLTPLRLETTKRGYTAAQFYRVCWDVLNTMQGFAAEAFDSIISQIEDALKSGGDIAMYRYKDRAATLQIISVSFFLEFYFEFLLSFKNHFPEVEALDQTINTITMRILTANDESDPLVKAQWFYQEFENRFL